MIGLRCSGCTLRKCLKLGTLGCCGLGGMTGDFGCTKVGTPSVTEPASRWLIGQKKVHCILSADGSTVPPCQAGRQLWHMLQQPGWVLIRGRTPQPPAKLACGACCMHSCAGLSAMCQAGRGGHAQWPISHCHPALLVTQGHRRCMVAYLDDNVADNTGFRDVPGCLLSCCRLCS